MRKHNHEYTPLTKGLSKYNAADVFGPVCWARCPTGYILSRRKTSNAKGNGCYSRGRVKQDRGKYICLDKKKFERKIIKVFLPINFNIYIGCSKEPSH